MAQNKKMHSTFRCVVMGANARRCSRTQNEILASKRELPVKNIKHPYSYVTPCYYILIITVNLYVSLESFGSTFTVNVDIN